MPIYEYQCATCGRFETIQKVSDRALQDCPTCGKAVSRLISAPAFQFKGSGWYVTDYARSGSSDKGAEATGTSSPPSADSKQTTSPPKESAASGSGGSDASSQTKTAAAPASASGSVPK
jgi:putative FmdB family regulatory protein